MKIAILTTEYITEGNWHGGLANYLSRIVPGLINRGHEVHMFIYSDKQEDKKENGVVIHRIAFNQKKLFIINRLTLNLFQGFFQVLYIAWKFRKSVLKINKKEKFDIIHASSCHSPSLFISSKKISCPIITRMSSVTLQCQLAYNRKNYIDMYLVNFCEKMQVKKSNKVFAPSKLVVDLIKRDFKININQIESPEYFKEKKGTDPAVYNKYLSGKKYILFYGTLGRLKGSEFIAENIYYFLNKYKDFHFVVVGKMEILKKGVLPIEPIIENAKEHKNRIFYTNSLPHESLFPIISNAKFVFLPSMIDNLPNTCIESMSLGKIVVGTYDGGFDQIIRNGENGFLLKYGDSDKLKKIFSTIMNMEKSEFEKIEKNAKDMVQKKLDYDSKLKELENFYIKAIKEHEISKQS